MTDPRGAYAFAFRLGVAALFGLVLALVPFWPYHMIILLLMTLWTVATLFVFPWLYVCYKMEEIRFPPWIRFVR